MTRDPVRRMAEEDYLESQYEEIAFEAFDFDVTRNRMPFDPHSIDGHRLLVSLPHGSVLINELGHAAQVHFEREPAHGLDATHLLTYTGTDVFVNLLHDVPPPTEGRFIVVYVPNREQESS